MKACTKCGATKPLSEYHRDATKKDGHLPQCKTCKGEYLRDYYRQHVEQRRAYSREWYLRNAERAREAGRKWNAENADRKRAYNRARYAARASEEAKNHREYRRQNPHKAAARYKVRDAIKRGVMQRVDRCEQCGSRQTIDAHHDDYTRPLDVRWLCRSCHRAHHGAEARRA